MYTAMVKDPLGKWDKVYTFCALLVDLGYKHISTFAEPISALGSIGIRLLILLILHLYLYLQKCRIRPPLHPSVSMSVHLLPCEYTLGSLVIFHDFFKWETVQSEHLGIVDSLF